MQSRGPVKWTIWVAAGIMLATLLYCGLSQTNRTPDERGINAMTHTHTEKTAGTETATFAAGCFWCVEAVFQHVSGVLKVRSGYTGGHVENPTYEQVCSGTTGHAEAVEIEFDPQRVSYNDLLDLFWRAHDPTQLNRQGADIGTQYRSAIFHHSTEQKESAEQAKRLLAETGVYTVTQLVPAGTFYEAESYHQNYFKNNPTAPYCMFVIRPKLNTLDSPSSKLTSAR